MQDGVLVLRNIGSQQLKCIFVREHRPHIYAESLSMETDNADSGRGTLRVSGYIRSQALSVNSLIHLPGWGDFQMTKIEAPEDPHPLVARNERRNTGDVDMTAVSESRVLGVADPELQTSLQSEVEPDPMEGEQTWPTEEELAEAEEQAKQKTLKRVPKGTSDYQAAWILPDSDGEGDEEEEEDEEYETITLPDQDDKYDEDMNLDDEQKMLEKYKEARQDEMFPDEMDTPQETP